MLVLHNLQPEDWVFIKDHIPCHWKLYVLLISETAVKVAENSLSSNTRKSLQEQQLLPNTAARPTYYYISFYLNSAFQWPKVAHSHTVILVVVNYDSSHSCPGAGWRKRGCHSAPPTTTLNIQQSYTFTRGKVGEVSCPRTQRPWCSWPSGDRTADPPNIGWATHRPTHSTTWATILNLLTLAFSPYTTQDSLPS